MSIKSAVSAAALISAMLVAPAFAQDAAAPAMTLGGNPVAEGDIEAVQARCDDLKLAKETQSLTTESADDDQATGDSSDAGADDAGLVTTPADDSESASTVDLSLVTLEECEAGGWNSAM